MSTLNPRKVWRHDSFLIQTRYGLKCNLGLCNTLALKLWNTKRENLTGQSNSCHGNRLKKKLARQSHDDRTQTKADKFRQHKTCRFNVLQQALANDGRVQPLPPQTPQRWSVLTSKLKKNQTDIWTHAQSKVVALVQMRKSNMARLRQTHAHFCLKTAELAKAKK